MRGAEHGRLGDHLERTAAGDDEKAVVGRRRRPRQSAPISLSSALCRPTSSRTGDDRAVAVAPGGGVHGAGQALSGWRVRARRSAAPTAAGSIGRAPAPTRRAAGRSARVLDAAQAAAGAPADGAPRARDGRSAARRPARHRPAAHPPRARPRRRECRSRRSTIPSVRAKPYAKSSRSCRRRHHHGEGRRRRTAISTGASTATARANGGPTAPPS